VVLLGVIGEISKDLGDDFLVDESPSIVIFWDRSSRWWHAWIGGIGIEIRNDWRALLVVIPDVPRGATTWDPVQ